MKKIIIILTIIFVVVAGYFIFNRGEVIAPTEEEKEEEEQKKEVVVKVFFANSDLNSEALCELVFPVERTVWLAKDEITAVAALEELLKGPTAEEEMEGYFTNINKGVKLISLEIDQGKAIADFNQQLDFQLGGSCRVTAIRAEITETLKQFPEIEEVVISVEGNKEGILQP
jgi:spore germination protein GerM